MQVVRYGIDRLHHPKERPYETQLLCIELEFENEALDVKVVEIGETPQMA